MATPSITDRAIDEWKKRLLDMSRRNRLLHFKETKASTAKLTEPDPDKIYEHIFTNEKTFRFPRSNIQPTKKDGTQAKLITETLDEKPLKPNEVRTNLTAERLPKSLYGLRLRSRTELEERGVNILYLACGFLHWFESESSDQEVKSPLVLVPVTLNRQAAAAPYELLLGEDEVVLNPTLIEKLMQDFGLNLDISDDDFEKLPLSALLEKIQRIISKQPRWRVTDDIYLTVFSFHKLIMFRDLENQRDRAQAHHLVSAIAGETPGTATDGGVMLAEEDLDEKGPRENFFQVLDADSSQQAAIEAVKAGASIVLHGPPGTGKSQTITNIIAEMIGAGKRVLFVSEKLAALEVVFDRLRDVGLDEFCLELHSHKANKREVVNNLYQTLHRDKHPAVELDHAWGTIVSNREKMNQYIFELHLLRGTKNMSVWAAIGQLSKMTEIPDKQFTLPKTVFKKSDVQVACESALEELDSQIETLRNADSNSWRHFQDEHITLELKDTLSGALEKFLDALSQSISLRNELIELLSIPDLATYKDISKIIKLTEVILDAPGIPLTWLENGAIELVEKKANKAATVFSKFISTKQAILQDWDEKIFDIDLESLKQKYADDHHQLFSRLKRDYREDRNKLRQLRHDQKRLGYQQALSSIKHISDTAQKGVWIKENAEEHSKLFGSYYRHLETDWNQIKSAIAWTKSLANEFADLEFSDDFLQIVKDPKLIAPYREDLQSSIAQLAAHLQIIDELTMFFSQHFEMQKIDPDHKDIRDVELESLLKFISDLQKNYNQIDDWAALNRSIRACREAGLQQFVDELLIAPPTACLPSNIYQKRFLKVWLDKVIAKVTILRDFSGKRHSKLIEKFQEFDYDLPHETAACVRAIASNRRPTQITMKAPSAESVILAHEANKKRRHMPLRKLFPKISELASRLKPCLLMSPLSVCQYLAADTFEPFDLVIFDEASQVRPEDAIGAVLRGNQIVVVGDNRQLPPTTFFETDIDDDNKGEEDPGVGAIDYESILDRCTTLLPSKRLKWHYRSTDETLIAFSNHHFYQNELLTFPAPKDSAVDPAVEFIHVEDGVYDRAKSRRNLVEAKRVADLVFDHFDNKPDESLGVVTFSRAQQEAVLDELEMRRRDQPKYEQFFAESGLGRFFVKNLENVQGDERDVIFIDVGYGRDKKGVFTHNFGPLNNQGGERRLNVLVSRARKQIKIISSITAHDIDGRKINTPGARLLKNYLAFAETGPKALIAESHVDDNAEFDSGFEVAVYEALVELGHEVQIQIGCGGYRIDLAIIDPEKPGRYLLGVECDGAQYHSSATARDRDRLRQQVLEDLGWQIYRIWSLDWLRDRAGQIDKLNEAITQAQEHIGPITSPFRKRKPTEEQQSMSVVTAPTQSVNASIKLPNVSTYEYTEIRRKPDSADFYRTSTAELAAILERVVEIEGPIHYIEATRRVAAHWGIARAAITIVTRTKAAIDLLVQKKKLTNQDGFLWPNRYHKAPIRRPRAGDSPRKIKHICFEEIGEGALICLESACQISKEDLIKTTANVLGYNRVAQEIKDRIERAIDLLEDNKRIVNKAGLLRLANEH